MRIKINIEGIRGYMNRPEYVDVTLVRLRRYVRPETTRREVEAAVDAALAGEKRADIVSTLIAGEVFRREAASQAH